LQLCVNTSDKLFTGVNDIGNKLSPVLLLQAINNCRCRVVTTGDNTLSRIFLDIMAGINDNGDD
jgi:hypothetical protein